MTMVWSEALSFFFFLFLPLHRSRQRNTYESLRERAWEREREIERESKRRKRHNAPNSFEMGDLDVWAPHSSTESYVSMKGSTEDAWDEEDDPRHQPPSWRECTQCSQLRSNHVVMWHHIHCNEKIHGSVFLRPNSLCDWASLCETHEDKTSHTFEGKWSAMLNHVPSVYTPTDFCK